MNDADRKEINELLWSQEDIESLSYIALLSCILISLRKKERPAQSAKRLVDALERNEAQFIDMRARLEEWQ